MEEKKGKEFLCTSALKQIFKEGKCVYETPDIKVLREYCKMEIDSLWEEVKRFENPHAYYVDLSRKLWELKADLLSQYGETEED